MSRIAFLLTTDVLSDRAISSKNILENIGFCVHYIEAIPRKDDSYMSKIESNRNSMMMILDCISVESNTENMFYYIFEDDIGCLEPIQLDEIVEYEKISMKTGIFYLGCCRSNSIFIYEKTLKMEHIINGNPVYRVFGKIRGAHAYAVTPRGAKKILDFINSNFLEENVFDEILEMYIYNHTDGVNIVRYDLESMFEEHHGIIYQDRNRFPTTIDIDS